MRAGAGRKSIMFSLSFIQEISQASISDVGDILRRYVQEACAADMRGAANHISESVYSALPEEENAPRILKLDEYAEQVGDPPPAIAEGFLHRNNLILLAGKPKHHKSFIATQILDDICRGRPIFGEFEITTPGPVIYLGMEDNPPEIKKRMQARGMIGLDLPFYCLTGQMLLNDVAGISQLNTLIEGLKLETKPCCVCIDTARHALGVDDWNDASKVVRVLKPLLEFTRKTCMVLLIVHNRKAEGEGGDSISGSNATFSTSDGRISVLSKRKLDNNDVQIEIEVETRSSPGFKRTLVMDTETLHINTLSQQDALKAQSESRAEERREWYMNIVKFISESSTRQATTQQVSDGLGIQPRWTSTLMSETLGKGFIEKTGESVAGSGRPAPLYRATIKGGLLLTADTYSLKEPKEVLVETEDI